MPNIEDEISVRTQAFATELAGLVRRAALEAVAATLGNPMATSVTTAGRPRAAVAPAHTAGVAAGVVKRGRGRPRKVVAAPVSHASAAKNGAVKNGAANNGAPAKASAKVVAGPVSKAAGSPRKVAVAKRPPGAKRPPAELQKLTEKLGEYVKANPGKRMEVIAKALGAPTKDLNLPVKKLLAGKKIRSEGHKRATEYFPA